MRARLTIVAVTALLALAASASAQAPLTAVPVRGAGPTPAPDGPAWRLARPVKVAMLPQTVALPHKPDPAVKELVVRAVHNGGWLALLIEWEEDTLSNRIVLHNFP